MTNSYFTFSDLDDDTIDAQSLLFLLAGYETSSSLLSFAVHVLATELDIQEKLREHINTFTEGREVTYEVLSQMTYLDWFIMGKDFWVGTHFRTKM